MNSTNNNILPTVHDEIATCREQADAAQVAFLSRFTSEPKTPQEERARQCRSILKREEILIRALRRAAWERHQRGDVDGFCRLSNACACPGERARAAHLALAFLRGWGLEKVEPTTKGPYRHLRHLGDEIAKKAGVPLVEIDPWIKAGWEKIESAREQRAALKASEQGRCASQEVAAA